MTIWPKLPQPQVHGQKCQSQTCSASSHSSTDTFNVIRKFPSANRSHFAPAKRKFQREDKDFKRSESVNSPCKKARLNESSSFPGPPHQVSSIALASESEATVKKVTLKPPDKDALPGKAKRRNRLEACDSTYNRETEAQTLSGLFKFYQTENLDMALTKQYTVPTLTNFDSMHARFRDTVSESSLWNCAASGCLPGKNHPFTPLSNRIQAQKKRRLEAEKRKWEHETLHDESSTENHLSDVMQLQTSKKNFPHSGSTSTGEETLKSESFQDIDKVATKKIQVLGDDLESVPQKILNASQLLQLKALKDELRAAEGTVRELKQLIAEIEGA